MLGYGMVMPIMPFYIEHFGAGGTELGWLMSTFWLMQLISAPIWGILSVGALGYAVTLFMFGLAMSFAMLFIASSLSQSHWAGEPTASGGKSRKPVHLTSPQLPLSRGVFVPLYPII
jgi:hypothetical protein